MNMDQLHAIAKAETNTPGVKMLMAVQLKHGRNPRVLSGTAMPDHVFSGIDPEEVKRRRAKAKLARKARAKSRAAAK